MPLFSVSAFLVIGSFAHADVTSGLIVHYALDDGSGTTASDAAGSNDGALFGGPIWTAGIKGGALSFDGVDDHVLMPSEASAGRSIFSVSFWIRTTESGATSIYHQRPTLFGNEGGTDDDRDFAITTNNGYIGYWHGFDDVTDERFLSNTIRINDDQWHHVAVTNTGAETRLYVDGSFVAGSDRPSNGDPLRSEGFTIAAQNHEWGHVENFHQGTFDDVRLYDRALSASEVQTIFEADNTLPSATVSVSPSFITEGDLATLTWSSTNANTCTGANFTTNGATSGSVAVSPSTDTTYTLTCTTATTVVSDSATLQVLPGTSGAAMVIYDTDFSSDVDDVGALATLHALADLGEAVILGVAQSEDQTYTPGAIDAVNTYYGRPDIPIGTTRGSDVQNAPYAQTLATSFPNDTVTKANARDAVEMYRDLLSSAPDNSVTIVVVGNLNNMMDLLQSTSADGHSELSGRDLVAQKVRQLVVMGGRYPDSGGTGTWNFRTGRNGASADYTVEHWPTPIMFSGQEIGVNILTGSRTAGLPAENPVREAYRIFNGNTDRFSWDQTAVLSAVRGAAPYWNLHTTGFNDVASNGSNVWRSSPDEAHAYLLQSMSTAELEVIIEDLMIAPPALRDVPEPNPIAHYPLDDGTGGAAVDVAGGQDGIVTGARWTDGILGGALSFDGTNDYVSLPSSVIEARSAFSVALWVKTTESGAHYNHWQRPTLIGNEGPQDHDRDFAITTSNGYIGYWHGFDDVTDERFQSNSVRINDNAWHHIAVTNSGSETRLYVDGSFVSGSARPSNGDPLRNTPFAIGAQEFEISGILNYHQGTIDDVRFYDRALSASQVDKLYNGGLGVVLPTVALTAEPAVIDAGESTTLTWSTTDASSCAGAGFSTGGATSGSAVVAPTEDTTFAVACSNSSGTVADSATVTVRDPSGKFEPGDIVVTLDNLNVRESPGTGATILYTQDKGELGTVVDGPVSADSYVWWFINYDSGEAGWSAEDSLASVEPAPQPGNLPSGESTVGCKLVFGSGDAPPAGFGAAYDVLSSQNELLLSVANCTSESATLSVGGGSATRYIWHEGYIYRDGAWQQINYTGAAVVRDTWFVNAAESTITRAAPGTNEQTVWYVAYTCTWLDEQWMCGCADVACEDTKWQLQGVTW